jgi:hypothetical protein
MNTTKILTILSISVISFIFSCQSDNVESQKKACVNTLEVKSPTSSSGLKFIYKYNNEGRIINRIIQDKNVKDSTVKEYIGNKVLLKMYDEKNFGKEPYLTAEYLLNTDKHATELTIKEDKGNSIEKTKYTFEYDTNKQLKTIKKGNQLFYTYTFKDGNLIEISSPIQCHKYTFEYYLDKPNTSKIGIEEVFELFDAALSFHYPSEDLMGVPSKNLIKSFKQSSLCGGKLLVNGKPYERDFTYTLSKENEITSLMIYQSPMASNSGGEIQFIKTCK